MDRLPDEKIMDFAKMLWATTNLNDIGRCRLFVESVLDTQIEHLRNKEMKLISDEAVCAICNNQQCDKDTDKCLNLLDKKRYSQNQLASDQLVHDKKRAELEAILKEAEQKLDDINAEEGSPFALCRVCGSDEYNATEGIVHEDTCLIKIIRKALQEKGQSNA